MNHANTVLPSGMRLPDALFADWLASWVEDLFIGIVPQHDRLNPREVAGVLDDITAILEALRFTGRPSPAANAERVWFYELADAPGFGDFPTVDRVARYHPELNPRQGLEDRPGDVSLTRRYDQAQFFEEIAFLLGTPTDEQMTWLRRLAYRTDAMQPLWDSPPRHHNWAGSQIRRCAPELAAILNVEWPEFDENLPIQELIRRAHNWVVGHARPELIRRGWLNHSDAGSPTSAPQDESRSTLGHLIKHLEDVERSRTVHRPDQQEQFRSGSANAIYSGAPHPESNEQEMPGIRRIELLCDLEPGATGMSAAKVQRLRTQICRSRRWQPQHADELTLNEAADILEGVQRVALGEFQQAQREALHHSLATLDHAQVTPEQLVQLTGLSCKVISGTVPTACPDANPVLPPSLLAGTERAVRRLYPLPTGTTIHWVGHDTGLRNRCRCHPSAPFVAPFDQHRWAEVTPAVDKEAAKSVTNAATDQPAQTESATASSIPFSGGDVRILATAVTTGVPALSALNGTAEPVVKRTGRPPDSTKLAIVEFVRTLREQKVPWKNIPEAVFQKFKTRYTSETLRGYLKSG